RTDAWQLVAHRRRIDADSNLHAWSTSEWSRTDLADACRVVAFCAKSDNSLLLVAESRGVIVGIVTCRGDSCPATRHVTSLAITVDRAWRNRGVGGRLIARTIEWAKKGGVVKRIELNVLVRNEPARHLYEKLGFVVEGR